LPVLSALLLLPGLDGTARLFSPLVPYLPAGWRAVPVAYPVTRVLDLDALVALARSHVVVGEPTVVIAESFSGPVGLRLANEHLSNLTGLVLVATFVTPPMGLVLRGLVRLGAGVGARLPVPRRMIRSLMLGRYGDEELLAEIEVSISSVSAPVLASRIRMLASVDAMSDLRSCAVPILYLGGTEDRLVPSTCTEQIIAEPSIANRFLHAPHLVLQTQPEAAAEEIANFLARLS
jgi:pimeloyl-ACP methyl ester carboxylesterase